MQQSTDETHVPHIGWLAHEVGDDVARYLREGWFEFAEQALCWLLLRPGECVVDCGAHVGLFSLLASQAVGDYGRVIALEPNPRTAALLRRNVGTLGAKNVEVIEAAASSKGGSLTLHAGAGPSSPYSSSVAEIETSSRVTVRAVALDDLVSERGVESVALLKIDVEGAELEAWRGCEVSAHADRIALVMVEFTEANQQAAGLTTQDVVREFQRSGRHFHRFNPRTLQLEPADVVGPIEYENLFATRDVEPINRRLREASPQRLRIARDVLARGETAHTLLKRGCDVEHYQHLLSDLQQRLDDSLKHGSEMAHELANTRVRLHTYAAYIERVVNSRSGRLARSLHLANMPGWIEMVQRDLADYEQARQ